MKQDKEQREKKREKRNKVIRNVVIVSLIAIPLLWGLVSMLDNVRGSQEDDTAIRVARLTEDGLTEDAMLTRQDITSRISRGFQRNAKTSTNTLALCDRFRDDILNTFWTEQTMSVESNRALAMNTVTGIFIINTAIEESEVASAVFDIYTNNDEYLQTFDRLLVSVNDRMYEQTNLRVLEELPAVELTIPDGIGTSTLIQDGISKEGLTELSAASVEEYRDGDISYISFSQDDCSSVDSLLSDYLYLFNEVYTLVGERPKTSVVLWIECGNSSSVIMVDAFKAYEYNYIMSGLDELAQYGYIMQYHTVYSIMQGDMQVAFSSLYSDLIAE